ncbi:hypothetical protein PN836_015145 [Ningiella sp. W23]|uniref:hypothetical protein n=1 Tax=Ningiella sp. W23 TaxID=3023715 RepID=UPI0037562D7E
MTLACLLLVQQPIQQAYAQSPSVSTNGTAYECTQVSLDEIDEALLTREERLALLDQSLSDSIDSYSTCVSAVQSDMAGGGSGSGSKGAGGDAGSASNAGTSGTESGSSTSNESLTNPESESQDATQSSRSQSGSVAVSTNSSSTSRVQRGVVAPKDNDSIICKLLYDEISNAQGEQKAGLEKQYKEYQCGS